MTGRDAFEIWAPAGARWVDWVRPVPFAAMNDCVPDAPVIYTVPNVFYADKPKGDLAIIVDAPGDSGIPEGIALAAMGFRPIPLYNGTNGQERAMALVDNHSIERALLWGALKLETIAIPPNAPPVFLLDSNRTHRYKMHASLFDNSWDLYDQDVPSAEYFMRCGVDRIVVRGNGIQKDLARILYMFQKKGMSICLTNGYDPPQKVVLRKPLRKRS